MKQTILLTLLVLIFIYVGISFLMHDFNLYKFFVILSLTDKIIGLICLILVLLFAFYLGYLIKG